MALRKRRNVETAKRRKTPCFVGFAACVTVWHAALCGVAVGQQEAETTVRFPADAVVKNALADVGTTLVQANPDDAEIKARLEAALARFRDLKVDGEGDGVFDGLMLVLASLLYPFVWRPARLWLAGLKDRTSAIDTKAIATEVDQAVQRWVRAVETNRKRDLEALNKLDARVNHIASAIPDVNGLVNTIVARVTHDLAARLEEARRIRNGETPAAHPPVSPLGKGGGETAAEEGTGGQAASGTQARSHEGTEENGGPSERQNVEAPV